MFSSPVATAEFSKFAGIQKDLNAPDNHDSVIAHLETDSLKGEVKWALGSREALLQTKLVEVMEFQLSYFKS